MRDDLDQHYGCVGSRAVHTVGKHEGLPLLRTRLYFASVQPPPPLETKALDDMETSHAKRSNAGALLDDDEETRKNVNDVSATTIFELCSQLQRICIHTASAQSLEIGRALHEPLAWNAPRWTSHLVGQVLGVLTDKTCIYQHERGQHYSEIGWCTKALNTGAILSERVEPTNQKVIIYHDIPLVKSSTACAATIAHFCRTLYQSHQNHG